VPECNVFTNCYGPQCHRIRNSCSRVSTRVFGKSNRNLEYVIIFFNISVTSKYVINLIIFPYKHPKIDFLAAYNSRTGNGLVKNSVLPSQQLNFPKLELQLLFCSSLIRIMYIYISTIEYKN
jgi:hypothetical protein